MNSFLRQSTASQSRAIGPFLSSTDFFTPSTGLTIANTDIKLVVNGAASANKASGGGTHRINGVYGITFDAADSATVGELFVSVVMSGALPVFHTFQVLEEAVFDALFAGSAPGYLQPTVAARTLDVSATGEAGIDWANIGAPTTAQTLSGTTIGTATAVTTVNGLAANSVTAAAIANGAIDAATFAAGAIDATAIANGAIDAATFAAGAIDAAAIATGAITSAKFAAGAINAAAIADGAIDALTFAAGAINAAAIATDAIDADALATSAVTEIQTGLATASAQTAMATDIDAIQVVTDKLNTMVEPDGGVYRFTVNALEQGPAGSGGGGGATVAAIWDELLSAHTIPGSAGATLANRASQASVDALNNLSQAQAQAAATAALTAYDPPTHAEMTAGLAAADDAVLIAIAGLNNVSQGQVQTAATNALNAYDPPTHTEMTAELAIADDAMLAAIAGLNNLSPAGAQAAATAALNAYDPPTYAEMAAGFAVADDAVLAAIAALPVAPSASANADALLARELGPSAVGAVNERTVRSALRFLRNRWAITGDTLNVCREDDSTIAWSGTVQTAAGNPVYSVDPT